MQNMTILLLRNNNSHIKIQRFKLSSPAEKYSGFPWNVKKYLKYFIKRIENCQDVHVLQDDCAKNLNSCKFNIANSVCRNTNSSFRKNFIYLLSWGKIRYCRVVTRFVHNCHEFDIVNILTFVFGPDFHLNICLQN